ncbi:MAG: 50S ribosomal protein L10, partial [Candidatus Poseidoniaceae archaeon]
MIPKVMSWKRDTVADLESLITSGDTIAVIDIHGVPADSMIEMRKTLRNDMDIRVAKKRLMHLAWANAGQDPETLESLFDGAVQPAIVSTSAKNSFELFTDLKATEAVLIHPMLATDTAVQRSKAFSHSREGVQDALECVSTVAC